MGICGRERGMYMHRMEMGSVVAEYPPVFEKKNPRNSEGAFLTLLDGTILFAYSKFKGECQEDFAASDICIAVSGDGGRTFGEGRVVLTCEEERAVNIMSLSLLRMENGDVGLFYLVRTTYTLLQMFLRRSRDGGKTFGERVLCTTQEGFFVVNNDRVLRLMSGRILIPAARHQTGREETVEGEKTFFDSRAEAVFFYSDDDGRSWRMSEGKCCMPYLANCRSGLQEPGVVELAGGILWGWARTDLGRQYEMYSLDDGNTWTGAAPSRFTSPNGPLSMKRAPGGSLLAVWNPIPEYNGREKKTEIFTGGRTPYVLAVSRDNGKSFSKECVFEDDEEHGYCYCAIHFTREAVLLAYNAGGPEDRSCLARIRIRRIPLSALRNL